MMVKNNTERQLEIKKELCRLADKMLEASDEDKEFYTSIGQLYALKLKEIQRDCLNSPSYNSCVIIDDNC